jgi:lysozyme
MSETIEEMITRHEGRKNKRYKDSQGIWTIGIGHNLQVRGLCGIIPSDRNLDTDGITDEEIDLLFQKDLTDTQSDINNHIPFFPNLDDPRQRVLIDMTFNMGIGSSTQHTGVMGFPHMLSCLQSNDFPGAAEALKDSKYYTQVGQRAVENYNLLKGGE